MRTTLYPNYSLPYIASTIRLPPGQVSTDAPTRLTHTVSRTSTDFKTPAQHPLVTIGGIDLHNISEAECVEHIVSEARAGRGGWVLTPNADIARLAQADPSLNALVSRADVRVADGMPLVWASRIQGTPLKARVCGSDLVWTVAEQAEKHGLSLFLLGGGRPDTSSRAAGILKDTYPDLKIAGTWYPPFGFENNHSELSELRAALTKASPDIIYVALGFPKAEKLIDEMRSYLPQAWWLGIGISLSFISGEINRAPVWMQRSGLEWLHRLTQETRRLASRYLVHGLPFALKLLITSMAIRLLNKPGRSQAADHR